jgi:hypothetical protein
MRLGYQALIGVIVIASSGSVFRLQFDDGASQFRIVRRQTGEVLVAPIRKIYDSRSLNSSARSLLGRLQYVQPIAIQQKGVISKQLVQLRNCRMTVGNGWTSNWLMVRATCSEVNFIAQSFRSGSSCHNAKRRGFHPCN